jgi:hypothetical protein
MADLLQNYWMAFIICAQIVLWKNRHASAIKCPRLLGQCKAEPTILFVIITPKNEA